MFVFFALYISACDKAFFRRDLRMGTNNELFTV